MGNDHPVAERVVTSNLNAPKAAVFRRQSRFDPCYLVVEELLQMRAAVVYKRQMLAVRPVGLEETGSHHRAKRDYGLPATLFTGEHRQFRLPMIRFCDDPLLRGAVWRRRPERRHARALLEPDDGVGLELAFVSLDDV